MPSEEHLGPQVTLEQVACNQCPVGWRSGKKWHFQQKTSCWLHGYKDGWPVFERMAGVLTYGGGTEGDPYYSTEVYGATAWALLEAGQRSRISGTTRSYRIGMCNLGEPRVSVCVWKPEKRYATWTTWRWILQKERETTLWDQEALPPPGDAGKP